MTRWFIIFLSIFAFGCGHGDHRHAAHDEHSHEAEVEGVTFDLHTGLTVPEETASFIGLELADVKERRMADEVELSARVYSRAPDGNALATGFMPATGFTLHPGMEGKGGHGQNRSAEVIVAEVRPRDAIGLTEVLFTVSPGDAPLSIGDAVTVTFQTEADTVMAVPKSALLETVEGAFVYTVSGDHFMRTPVGIGRRGLAHIEVTDGLYAGDQVAIHPVKTLWLAELQAIRGGKACADGH